MARARRRSTRANPQKSLSPVSSATPAKADSEGPAKPEHSKEDLCPACQDDKTVELNDAEKENWIRCDACKEWYHWRCAGDGGDVEAIDKWFCQGCLKADPKHVITLKPPARKSSRKRTQRDYANLNSGLGSNAIRWIGLLEQKSFKDDTFKRMKGSEVGIEWLETDESAMREPIVIEKSEGLGMKMPGKPFTVDDVAEAVGEDIPVEVIDVASQSNTPGWTLRKWADYYNLEPSARDKIRNVISLEITGTPLGDQVLPPRLVRELDWVEKFWPNTKRGKGQAYPKVQLYCLMGVANAWTDWHIDFAGSSVYYHVLYGCKVFYFIKPTTANLAAYERWSGTEIQNHQWLGDMVDEVVKVTVVEGNTMIIPTGWIHAVYTPVDTLVFGGNFLHSYNVATQLKVRDIEISTHVPKKFRFPQFARLCWYVGDKYLRDLKAKEEFPKRVLDGIEALAGFLVQEARTIERGSEQAKREAKEQVPSDRIKDPSAVARELRWRVRQATGLFSDDEDSSERKITQTNVNGSTRKRKRVDLDGAHERTQQFKNFKPRLWETVVEKDRENEKRVSKAHKPEDGDGWKDQWLEWRDDLEEGDEGNEVDVNRKKEVVIKIRRTAHGVERQRVERVVEEWIWSDESSLPSDDSSGVKVESVEVDTMVVSSPKEDQTKDREAALDTANSTQIDEGPPAASAERLAVSKDIVG